MPERLQHIPDAEVGLGILILTANSTEQDPGFFEMVEYFFHKACVLSEDRLIEVDMKQVRATKEEKANKAHGNVQNVWNSTNLVLVIVRNPQDH